MNTIRKIEEVMKVKVVKDTREKIPGPKTYPLKPT